jgi:hypothetical protein
LYFAEYDFFVGKATYINNVQAAAWDAIAKSSQATDSVLRMEKALSERTGDKKFNFETKGRKTEKVVSAQYASSYHRLLSGMVERQFRASVKMTGDVWFTAWVDAGQPDLKGMINYQPTKEELERREEELMKWKEKTYSARQHDE